MRDYRYLTDRLLVNEWKSFTKDEWPLQDLTTAVLGILTESVTETLPPSWQGPYTPTRAQRWIQERNSEGVTLLAVDKQSHQALGMLILYEIENSGDLRLGYMLAESCWGRGYASELIEGFVAWCRTYNIRSVTGGVERGNVASRRVLEKCGFIADTSSEQSDELLFTIEIL